MAIETQELTRAFRYNSVDLQDPGPSFNLEQVRDFYATMYPEIVSAAIEGPEQKDDKLVYTFRRAVGTKGSRPHGPGEWVRIEDEFPPVGALCVVMRADPGAGTEGIWVTKRSPDMSDEAVATWAAGFGVVRWLRLPPWQ